MSEGRSHLSYLRRWCGNRVCSGSNRCERRSWSRGLCWRKAQVQQDRWIDRSPSPSPASRYALQGSRARPPWRSWETAGEFLEKNEERHAVRFENTSGCALRSPCRNGNSSLKSQSFLTEQMEKFSPEENSPMISWGFKRYPEDKKNLKNVDLIRSLQLKARQFFHFDPYIM